VEIGSPSGAEILVRVLEDEAFDIRWIAAEGLISLGMYGLVPLLHTLVNHPDHILLRDVARHILHGLSQRGMRSLLAPLTAALDSPHPAKAVPVAASQVLETIRLEEE
jgi:HEAT repeat protein